ncbi:lipopolysaccharide transport periplasmic protein LptA [Umboniibacter marinipuniceus]|uniref:Lipopolysaccharide export system protein LptA n=1 Tax=Umboniibacter marinipuniceus TaxID=569599 RepID=A0A3M0A385_9GAMM|nr:lipopolysaccharide transport periplasmic protein LptA [Umboniibacter marinipuniceus]RMA79443.1 lipopolysaccharide export system protein LptA [Umboniibacter marinipuniceus]
MLKPIMNLLVNATLLLLICVFLSSANAHGLPEDRDKPIEMFSEDFSQDVARGITSYIGNAKIIQGSLIIEAGRIDVFYEDGEVVRVLAIGPPATFKDTPSSEVGEVYAQGNQVDYDLLTKLVVVTGEALFSNKGSEVSANRIEFDLERGAANASGGVRHVIQPPAQTPSEE